MTALPIGSFWISPEEYLEGELLAEFKHEYVAGQVHGMAGASRDHNLIAANMSGNLWNHRRGKRCTVFTSDMKVKIPREWADAYYYPDVSVGCDPTDQARYFLERPSLIVEVLSPDTSHIDRREKRLAYRAIPSMQLYLILEQDRIAATVLRRSPEGWREEQLEGVDALLRLDPVELECRLGLLYERTSLMA